MAMSPFQTFANREVADLTFCDFTTGKPILFMNYANVTSTSLSGETVHAIGGMGAPKRVTFGGNREGTLTIETQINCAQLYAIVTGGELSTSAEFLKRYVIKAEGTSLKIPQGAGTVLATGLVVYEGDDDCGQAIEGATLSEGSVTATGLEAGKEYIVYCMVKHTDDVQKLSISGRVKSKAYKIYGLTNMKDEDDVVHDVRMIVHKATPQANVEWGYSNTGDPASMTLTFDMAADKNDNFIDMIYMDGEE